MINRRQFIGSTLAGLTGLVLTSQSEAASKKDITEVIEKLKKKGKVKHYSIKEKRKTSYESKIGKLTTDAGKYDDVVLAYQELDNKNPVIIVIGLNADKHGLSCEYVFDGGEKFPLDGNPDASLRKYYTLKELLEKARDALSDEDKIQQDLRNGEGAPTYSAKCLYDSALRKFLR